MELSQDVQARLDQLSRLPIGARLGIMAAVGVLVGAIYYFTTYQDAKRSLETLHAKELELERKLSEVRSVASNIAAFEEEIANLEIRLAQVVQQLPNDKELEVLLTDVSNLGKKAGIEIKSFRRREEKVHDFYAEVPIDLVLEGDYHDIARFFDLVSRLPRIVNVSSLQIKVRKESLEGTSLSVEGTATTFRFVGDKAA
jgi:type IV pilus assembly protein PilO